MCVAEDGRVIVANKTNAVVFAVNGTYLGSFPVFQPGDPAVNELTAIACSVDGGGAVFVADFVLNTVRKFLQSAQPAAAAAKQAAASTAVALAAAGTTGTTLQGREEPAAAAGAAVTEAALAGFPADSSMARMQARVAAFAAHMSALPLSPAQLERLAGMADSHGALLDTFQEELQVQS